MPNMTKQQRDYAIARVRTVHQRRVQKVREAHTLPEAKLSRQERVDIICSGRVKIKDEYFRDSYRFRDVAECFEWPDEWALHSKVRDTANPELETLNAQLQRVEDAIMLGDAAEALSLIEEYES